MKFYSTSAIAFSAGVGLAVASSLTAVQPAEAFTLSINPKFGSTENTGATANLDFNFEKQGNDVLVKLNIKNTTNGQSALGATQATLVGVTFDLLDGLKLTGYNASGSNFTQLWNGVALNGGGFGRYDYGVSTPRNSFEGGNANGGLKAGDATSVRFLLTGSNSSASDLEAAFLKGFQSGDLRVAARYQQVNAGGGSDKVAGGFFDSPSGSNSAAVPEPTTMVGMALAGAGLTAYRRRAATNK